MSPTAAHLDIVTLTVPGAGAESGGEAGRTQSDRGDVRRNDREDTDGVRKLDLRRYVQIAYL